jgi:hypothetical protein
MRRKVIAATLTVLAVSGCSTAHESTSPTLTTTVYVTPTPIATTPPHPAPPVAKGQWAFDGLLAAQVTTTMPYSGTSCYDWPTDCGPGIELFIYVNNNTYEPHTYRADLQRLVDDKGRSYAPNTRQMKLDELSININPGSTVGPLLMHFNVPDAVAMAVGGTLLFRGSANSPGALSRLD